MFKCESLYSKLVCIIVYGPSYIIMLNRMIPSAAKASVSLKTPSCVVVAPEVVGVISVVPTVVSTPRTLGRKAGVSTLQRSHSSKEVDGSGERVLFSTLLRQQPAALRYALRAVEQAVRHTIDEHTELTVAALSDTSALSMQSWPLRVPQISIAC